MHASIWKSVVVLFAMAALSGCLGAKYDWPKASADADQIINLNSNIERTDFYVDGNKVATGRRVKVLINDNSHTVVAAPPGYKTKEEFLQPPYNDYSTLSFIFMLGDRVQDATGSSAAGSQVAPSAASVSGDFRVPFQLPEAKHANDDAVAVIIGNKNYRQFNGDVPDVDFAHNDADLMFQYATRTLGIREGNIILLKDATQAQLLSTFGTLDNPKGKLSNWVRPGLSDVLIFYSGHGVPSLKDGRGYLLPVDADPATVDINGYPLDTLYGNLNRLSARKLTVAIDACFSGVSNNGAVVKSASSISLKVSPPKTEIANGSLITAAGMSEVASWDKTARLGLMTRYLVEGLSGQADKGRYGNGDGKVTLNELQAYLGEEVSYKARREYGREQHPEVVGDNSTIIN